MRKLFSTIGAVLAACLLLFLASHDFSQAQTGGGSPPVSKINNKYIVTGAASTSTGGHRLLMYAFSVFYTSSSSCTMDSASDTSLACVTGLAANTGQVTYTAFPNATVACTCSDDGIHTSGAVNVYTCSLSTHAGASSVTLQASNGAATIITPITNADCIITGY